MFPKCLRAQLLSRIVIATIEWSVMMLHLLCSEFYIYGRADSFVATSTLDCCDFNTGATVCKVEGVMGVARNTIYDFVSTQANLTVVKSLIDHDKLLQEVTQKPDSVLCFFARRLNLLSRLSRG